MMSFTRIPTIMYIVNVNEKKFVREMNVNIYCHQENFFGNEMKNK